MDLKKIASVAGKSGLFRIVKPARSGVVLESLEESPSRFAAGPSTRVSVLQEISIYTTDGDGSVPLTDVLMGIYQQREGQPVALDKKAEGHELRTFMETSLPNYDPARVYDSDIRKLATWYDLLLRFEPGLFVTEENTTAQAPANNATDAAADDAAATEPTA